MAATRRQALGTWGERTVADTCNCPRCTRTKTFRLLPRNFKCADVICDFCGYLGQVKTMKVRDAAKLPRYLLGAAWAPQRERMDAGILTALYVVLRSEEHYAVYLLPPERQPQDMFVIRRPLGPSAKQPGWQGFIYDLTVVSPGDIRRIAEGQIKLERSKVARGTLGHAHK